MQSPVRQRCSRNISYNLQRLLNGLSPCKNMSMQRAWHQSQLVDYRIAAQHSVPYVSGPNPLHSLHTSEQHVLLGRPGGSKTSCRLELWLSLVVISQLGMRLLAISKGLWHKRYLGPWHNHSVSTAEGCS